MLKLNKKSKIYILCPAYIPTGGPESIHLLCENLLKRGLNAYIVYNHSSHPGGIGHPGHGVIDRSDDWVYHVKKEGNHPEYDKYNTQSTDYIEDNENNLLINEAKKDFSNLKLDNVELFLQNNNLNLQNLLDSMAKLGMNSSVELNKLLIKASKIENQKQLMLLMGVVFQLLSLLSLLVLFRRLLLSKF